ncbi:MAG: hypothetical protein AAGD11_14870 [Planctomycetota bacterium]
MSLAMLCVVLASSVNAQRYLIDLGVNDGVNGFDTPAGPDINGNHWNNYSSSSPVPITGFTLSGLIDDTGSASGIGLETYEVVGGGSFGTNGLNNGGLAAGASHAGAKDPDGPTFDAGSAQFGLRPAADYAIATVTGDYFWTSNNTGAGIKITGLDPTKTYNLDLFGTRATNNFRETQYTAIGGNGTFTQNLFTSGFNNTPDPVGTLGPFEGIGSDGVYNANDQYVVNINGVAPNASNEIELVVGQGSFVGGFYYLGALGIIEVGVDGIAGDFDGDDDVDGADLLEWQRTDATSSGLTDWLGNYGTSASLSAVAVIPEPGTVGLLTFGFVTLVVGGLRRDRRTVR